MKTLLQIQSSLFGDGGKSSALANAFTERWLRQNPEGKVIRRDLAAAPVPHLDLARFQSFTTPAQERTPEQQAVDAFSMELIGELQRADTIVMGVPMYNFIIPSMLHTYFDHIARAGITFRYTGNGPEGLLQGKKAYVFITRGGLYGEDHVQTGYLKEFLGFLGITDVEFVYAEGLAMPEHQTQSFEKAQHEIDALLAA